MTNAPNRMMLALCAGVLTLAGCAGVESTPDAGTPALAYAGQISCSDNGAPPVSAKLTLGTIESCTAFTDGAFANRLDLSFKRESGVGAAAKDFLSAQINKDFTKAGEYKTGPDEGDTSTFVVTHGYNDTADGTGAHATPGGGSAGGADCRGACTIVITDASVLSAPKGGKGRVAGSITCASLAAAGVGCVKCTMAPATVQFDTSDCLHP